MHDKIDILTKPNREMIIMILDTNIFSLPSIYVKFHVTPSGLLIPGTRPCAENIIIMPLLITKPIDAIRSFIHSLPTVNLDMSSDQFMIYLCFVITGRGACVEVRFKIEKGARSDTPITFQTGGRVWRWVKLQKQWAIVGMFHHLSLPPILGKPLLLQWKNYGRLFSLARIYCL